MAINRIKTGGITDGTIQSGDLAPGTVANDRLANNTITINGTSIALGASGDIVAGTDWQAVSVADGSTTVNTTAGAGYFLDTNAGVIEVFLPTSPTRGDTVILVDYAGTFATNNVIVNTGTTNLDSTTTRQYRLTTNDTIAEFVYVDSAKGWITRINTTSGTTPSGVFTDGIYDQDTAYISATGGTILTNGDFKTHVFTGDGCFVVTQGPVGAAPGVDYLVVAGGGGGGNNSPADPGDSGGGGGGGGVRFSAETYCGGHPKASPTGLTVTATTYPITVGGGGAGVGQSTAGNPGSPSIFSTITSAGGGGGGAAANDGKTGGSGGGGSGGGQGGGNGGAGNTPPTSPSQGEPGGEGGGGNPAIPGFCGPYSPDQAGGGGGGAGQIGGHVSGPANTNTTNKGGDGIYMPTTFFGPTAPSYGQAPAPLAPNGRYFGGGGGGSSPQGVGAPFGATGGAGGGSGYCSDSPPTEPIPVTQAKANTGGGAAGAAATVATGNVGGKGIVVLRYKFQ